MFDHVGLWVSDDAAVRLYRTLLGVLGREPTSDRDGLVEWDDFALSPADGRRAVASGVHLGFAARDRAAVEAFHAAGLAAGAADDGAPSERRCAPGYYGAFLLDRDGNSIEAVHLPDDPAAGTVDHVWLRVADHDRSLPFYRLLAEHAGQTVESKGPARTLLRGRGSSFSIVTDERPPTRNLHIAWPASRTTIQEWHAAAVAAGFTDNGGPGLRPEYHEDYYGAFVLDPDGNNVELVDHHR